VGPPFRIEPRTGRLGNSQRFLVSIPSNSDWKGLQKSRLQIRLDRAGFLPTNIGIDVVVEIEGPFFPGGRGEKPAPSPAPSPAPPPRPAPAPPPPTKSLPIPSPLPPPPPPQPREATWNGWIEQGVGPKPRWEPVNRLDTSSSYSFVLNLALSRYLDATSTVVTSPIGPSLKTVLDQLPASQERLELEVLIVAEAQFVTLEPTFHTISIDVARMREGLAKGINAPATISFEELRNGRYSEVNLGGDAFPFKTTGLEGVTSLAVSIWHRGVPVDELTMGPFCITRSPSSPCSAKMIPLNSLSGLDSGMSPAVSRERLGQPLGALHLINVNDRTAYGVLARSDHSTYTTWELNYTIDEIAKQIKTSVNQSIVTAASFEDPKWLDDGGDAIANMLFLGTQLSQGPSPWTVLAEMVQAAATQTNPAPPALFVRAVAKGRSPLFGIPLALARVPVTPGSSQRDYIGFALRVEMPLEGVQYDRAPACIARWVVLAPPNDPRLPRPLKEARAELETWLDRLRMSNSVSVYDTIADFRQWASQQPAGDPESTAVVIVSHHDGGRLYMSPSDALPAANIQRRLHRPAAVILSACGTAEPGGTDVMRNFVLAGANAVIGTGTEVEGRMAGKFVSLLLDDIQGRAGNATTSIGQSTFAVQQKLRQATFANGQEYGAFALLFGLAGDAGLQLCLPSK
jgi:CHAT domain-containing protein